MPNLFKGFTIEWSPIGNPCFKSFIFPILKFNFSKGLSKKAFLIRVLLLVKFIVFTEIEEV